MKKPRTWILIADGGRARVLESPGPGRGVSRVEGLDLEAGLSKTSDLMSDRQGRSFESSNTARHALEPRTDPHESLKAAFIGDVLGRIDARFESGAFDRLVVVAPPQVMGDIRKSLPARLQAVLDGEIVKDLTKTPDHDLASHLADVVKI